ncbi:NAD-dependent epimerase/dehydratase family protein [Patescibacteria group bacterium]|nr:NAD-dependent epimerase/dehydratase family protein [Patescibacteria group bacterium]
MSKVLITGGAGFIGSNLTDALIAQGHQIVIIDDLSSGLESYVNPGATFYQLDISSDEIEPVFAKEKPDFVFHLAAQIEVAKSMIDPRRDAKINLDGGLKILEACRLYNVKKIIFSSTGGAIYGDTDLIPTKEDCPAYPLSFYGIHKLTFEKYLNLYYRNYALDYSVLRFANVYGPRQFKGGEAGVIAIFTDNAVADKASYQYGDGLQTRDFVFVADVVRALISALEINYQGEINISYGLESSLLDIREALKKALNKEILIEEKPAKPGEQRRSCLDNSLAKKILNWEPEVNLEEGIMKTVNWAKNKNI